MSMATARFTLRIHPLVMKKMKVIANYNGRSVNKEIEQILKLASVYAKVKLGITKKTENEND